MFLQFTISLPQILYEICEKKKSIKNFKTSKVKRFKNVTVDKCYKLML